MVLSRGFALITAADLVARSAYQMGKTPLLPIYAAALGAGDIFLGFIVSISTFTGMATKPLFGILSDRWGRRMWLLVGTAFFAGVPFVYRFVNTPEQLFAVRMVHGLATAVYGPVTLAYVAELSREHRAERFGWFSMARSAGYVVGPLAAGWMLLYMDPVSIFTVIGILSSLVFIPILLLPDTGPITFRLRVSMRLGAVRALWSGGRTPAVWLAGGLEAVILAALYAARAFLPIHALSIGASTLLAGTFFAVQEAVHLACGPVGGRVGDRLGHLATIGIGVAILGAALTLLTLVRTGAALIAPAVLMGIAQGLAFPSVLALVSTQVDGRNLGLGMGLVGTLKNAGKIAGPVLAGALIYWFDFTFAFRLLGMVLLGCAPVLWFISQYSRTPSPMEGKTAA
jgi:MFS family permease